MDSMKFHHVGLVTPNIEAAIVCYQDWGYEPSELFNDPVQKANIVLLTKKDSPIIELICPNDNKSFVKGWQDKIHAGPYHTCYEVTDLEAAIARLSKNKLRAIRDPAPAIAFGGRRIVFLWGVSTGLLELLEA